MLGRTAAPREQVNSGIISSALKNGGNKMMALVGLAVRRW